MNSNAQRLCPSCPFLEMNHKEFGVIAKRLCAKFGKPAPDFWACLSTGSQLLSDLEMEIENTVEAGALLMGNE